MYTTEVGRSSFGTYVTMERADAPGGTLTIGEKKKLELARALATGPELLLLDEVMAGSTQGEIDELVEVLRGIHAAGTTILILSDRGVNEEFAAVVGVPSKMSLPLPPNRVS